MNELVYQTNKTAYDFKKAVLILKTNFPTPFDLRYIDVQKKRLSKVFYPKVFSHPDYVDMKFSGKQFARLSEIDYLANSVRINNQEVRIKPDKSLIKLHKEILKVLNLKENTQHSMRILFVLIPWLTEAKVYSFEGDLSVIKEKLCKNPDYRPEEKSQVVAIFLKEIKEFTQRNKSRLACQLWANKKMQDFKENFSDQSLIFICEKARLAMNCVKNSNQFQYKPQTIKKKKATK